MKKYRVLLTTVLLVLLLGVLAPQFSQNVPTAPGEDDRESPTAIGFVRTINTAEVVEASTLAPSRRGTLC